MNRITLASGLVAAGMLGGAGATAGFVGVTWTTTFVTPGITTYRFFAQFDDPADVLLAVSGSPDDTPVEFATNTVLFNNGGPFAGTKPEDFAQFPISGLDDSWVTIGATGFAGNDTDYSPNFLGNDGLNPVIVGSAWSEASEGWFDSNPGTPAIGGAIVIAQFSLLDKPDGSRGFFQFSGGVDYQPGGAGLDRGLFFLLAPAPGGLPLLMVTLIAGRRRRTA